MTISSTVVNRLSQVSIFQGLGPAELEELALMCTRKTYEPDSKLTFIEGEKNPFCVINQGIGIVKIPDSSGEGRIIGELEPGDYFGEVSSIDSEQRDFEVFAGNKQLEILLFMQKDFLEVLQNYPSIHLAISRELCRRLRITKHKVSYILLPSKVRVAMVLLSTAHNKGTLTNDGTILPKLTQSELAKMSDSSKETINKSLIELKDDGLLFPTESKHIMIPNKKKLEEWIKVKSSE